MSEKIIVGVDGSPASTSAVDWVADRALDPTLGPETRVEFLTVIESVRMPHGQRLVTPRAPYDQLQHTVASRAEGLTPTFTIVEGNPSRALIIASRRADLLVLGSARGRAPHGTTDLRVAGRAECPTVVVPLGWAPGRTGVVCGWTDDGTADAALEFAAREARRTSSPVTIVHAWRMPVLAGYEATGMEFTDIADLAGVLLEEVAARLRSAHPGVEILTRLVAGSPAAALTELAREAALVVVGSHGRGALGGLILGSVSHDVLMSMPSPVAIIPSPEPIAVLPEIVDEDL